MSGPKADIILATTGAKKKKRKAKSSTIASSGMILDDDGGWGDQPMDEEEDDAAAAVVASDRTFKKRKVAPGKGTETSWVTVQEGEAGPSTLRDESPAPAADEQPTVVDMEVDSFKGGLIKHGQKKKKRPQDDIDELLQGMTAEEIALAQQTVYRDSSGKKIDMEEAKAAAERQKREREAKEIAKKEWGKGVVQREQAKKRQEELQKQKDKGFRRTDDVEMNEELKAKDMWNDPAAAFLTVRLPSSCCQMVRVFISLQKKKSKSPRRPEYTGPPPPPNRFGIKPGYRWDGVGESSQPKAELPLSTIH